MGNTIGSRAAAGDIVSDVKTTHINATARGGAWQTHADAKLAPVIALLNTVEADLQTARDQLAPLAATVAVENERSDDMLGRISDEIWNAGGRGQNDAGYSFLFPGGISYYTAGDVGTQPIRMRVLAMLFESHRHPRLTAAQADAYALEVRGSADQLQQAVDNMRPVAATVEVLDRVFYALARNAALELASLKRLYKSEGFSEADIHTVIPDRPRSTPTDTSTPPGTSTK